MNKIIRITLWNPLKYILSIFPAKITLFIKLNVINFLSYFGFSNSQNRMDKSIINFFNFKKNGVCLEVGAADGIDQSNSLLLERLYNWEVYLVEPTKSQFELCKTFRGKSNLNKFAFVSEDTFKKSQTIEISLNTLMSTIDLQENDVLSQKKENVEVVPTITLDKFIHQNEISTLDILILDVEGYEIEVLEGYQNSIGTIKYLLVETWDFEKFNTYANHRDWKFIKNIGSDYLYDLNTT